MQRRKRGKDHGGQAETIPSSQRGVVGVLLCLNLAAFAATLHVLRQLGQAETVTSFSSPILTSLVSMRNRSRATSRALLGLRRTWTLPGSTRTTPKQCPPSPDMRRRRLRLQLRRRPSVANPRIYSSYRLEPQWIRWWRQQFMLLQHNRSMRLSLCSCRQHWSEVPAKLPC